jgi:universal stress protein family protein
MSEATVRRNDPTDGAGDRPPRVVVGVDGSPGSRAALVYALTAAARRGADLLVVSTYSIQAVWVGGTRWACRRCPPCARPRNPGCAG